MTTSAIGAEVDYIGGDIIHKVVDQPDTIHRFAHQDIFANVIDKTD